MPQDPRPIIGVIWCDREQWERLKATADDRDQLDDTFEEWQATVGAAMQSFEAQGMAVRKVDLDVDELLAWCRSRGRRNDGPARAEYASAKLQGSLDPTGS
jgi:hypothetical protein